MAYKRTVEHLVKHLLRISMGKDGFISEEKVSAILQVLREKPPRNHLEVLRLYLKKVRRAIDQATAKVEYMGRMEAKNLELLKSQLEGHYKRPLHLTMRENAQIIAGFLVQVGDDVWDASVAGRLGSLSTAI